MASQADFGRVSVAHHTPTATATHDSWWPWPLLAPAQGRVGCSLGACTAIQGAKRAVRGPRGSLGPLGCDGGAGGAASCLTSADIDPRAAISISGPMGGAGGWFRNPTCRCSDPPMVDLYTSGRGPT